MTRRHISDLRQIKALVSPVRQELIDTAQALGPCSVRDLAREMGRPADSLYYHVKALVRAKLLEPAGERGSGRARQTLYATPSADGKLALVYRPGDPDNAAAVTRLVAGMLRVTARDFAAAYRGGAAVTEGPGRNLWAARGKGWLTAGDVEEVHRLLDRLRRFFDRPRAEVERRGPASLHALTFVIAPVDARRRRRRD